MVNIGGVLVSDTMWIVLQWNFHKRGLYNWGILEDNTLNIRIEHKKLISLKYVSSINFSCLKWNVSSIIFKIPFI